MLVLRKFLRDIPAAIGLAIVLFAVFRPATCTRSAPTISAATCSAASSSARATR